MPQKPKPKHPELPFGVPEPAPNDAPGEPLADAVLAPRKMGRPRKWGSEAERKRAYRERLAADLAEPERLRRELRNAKRQATEKARQLAQIERDLASAEAEIERRSKREFELERTVERIEARADDWRSRATALARNLEAERLKVALLSTTPATPATPPARPKPPPSRRTKAKPKRRKRR